MTELDVERRPSEFRTHILHPFELLFLRGVASVRDATDIQLLWSGPDSDSGIHWPIRL